MGRKSGRASQAARRRGEPTIERKQELLFLLRARDGDNCKWCKIIIDFTLPREDDLAFSFDHIKAHADGGSWHVDNLQLMHRKCNCEEGRWEELARKWKGLDG